MVDFLDKALGLVERALEWLIAVLVTALLLIVASTFIDRHFVTLPMAAPDAYARIILVWLTFVGFALAVKGGLNIRVDLIDARLPAKVRRVLDYVFDLIMLGLTVMLGVNGWRLVVIGQDQERLGTGMSEAWPSAALLVACILLVLFLVLRIALRYSGRELPRHVPLEAE
ncbi:MAG TPA: TRAP transporter small permease subunit [Burkholderiales bacterium]|nr:TRAP transporter small permease subunit [Burkholderiales bacterium]